MSIVFKPFSVSNDYNLSGIYGVITDNVGMCVRNSYVNNGTGIANLSNNSKGYVVNCNDNFDQIREIILIPNTTLTGNINELYYKEYDSSEKYTYNNKVIYNDVLYTCKKQNVTGTWDANCWTIDNSIKKYNTSTEYNIGDKVIQGGKIYTPRENKVKGTWNLTKWYTSSQSQYTTQQLTNFGVNCAISKNSSFSIDSVSSHNIYQEVFTDQFGSLYNFPNFDKTIPLINILNSDKTVLKSYFRKPQLYSDYDSNVTYSYGTVVFYSQMYFMCLKNSTKGIIPGEESTSSIERWGAYSIANNTVYKLWDDNYEYDIGDVVYYNYNFYKCVRTSYTDSSTNEDVTVAGHPPITELAENGIFWESFDPDKSVLQYKYSDFVDVITVPEWKSLINYSYGDVVHYNDKYYMCVNSAGVTENNIDISNGIYWSLDGRFDEKFDNVYRRFDNIFVNDGNVMKFTNKSYLKEDTTFKVKNLLDVEILQNYIPRNLNGHELTIEIYGMYLKDCINSSVILYNGDGNNHYYLSTNNRNSFDPTNIDMLKHPFTFNETNNPYSRYSAEPTSKPTDISTSYYSTRPITAKFNISGFYGGKLNVKFINGDYKNIDTNRGVTYTRGYGMCNVPKNNSSIQYYIDTIPCSFTFKDVYGKLTINGDCDNSNQTRITLNTVKSDGYIFKFINCENVEINNIQFYMSYPNKFGGINVGFGTGTNTVTPNDCYQSFLIFDNSKAVVNNCWFKFLYYNHNDHINYITETYQTIKDNHGQVNKYLFNHDFAGLKDSDTLSNDVYIIEGLVTCENNSQVLLENPTDPSEFTNIKGGNSNADTNYISVLSNSQVTWLPIGVFTTVKVRENMLQYLVNHFVNGSFGKCYKNTSLSLNSDDFFNGPAVDNTYVESLARCILKSSLWKRILRNYGDIQGSGDNTLSLTPQMLFAFLKLWVNTEAVDVSPIGMDSSTNKYFTKTGSVLTNSNAISDAMNNETWDLTQGKFKAAKILIDLLKTVEQNINFDVKTNNDMSVSSFDTTQPTGTAIEYKRIEKTVDTTLLDSIQGLISLLTLHDTTNTGTVDDRLNVEFLNVCSYEDNLEYKPKSLINGALDVFETVLTSVCNSMSIPSPTYDLNNVIDITDVNVNNGATISQMIINFIGKRSELNRLGFKIISNFNNNIFYPEHNEYFYDVVYVPENNEESTTPVTTFSYEQVWSLGNDLLGGSEGSSINSAGGIWDDNTEITMTYQPLEDNVTPITDDTQCIIKLTFNAPKMLFEWMKFFEAIDSLNWTCKTFMGVVNSLLFLFNKGDGDNGKLQLFPAGYTYAYTTVSPELDSNPFYLLWFYLYNPSTNTGKVQKSLQIAEQLYTINQLLSNFGSTNCGLLNHHHLYPNVVTQYSGLPIGTVGVTWRSYIINKTSTSFWSFPTSYNNRAGLLYGGLDSGWEYCDNRDCIINQSYIKSNLSKIFGAKTPIFNEWKPCLNHTYYTPYFKAEISGYAKACSGDGDGSQTVSVSAGPSTSGPVLRFSHSASRPSAGLVVSFSFGFGWKTENGYCYTGDVNKATTTSSFFDLFNQMGYKIIYNVNGTDTPLTLSSNQTTIGSSQNLGSGASYNISNIRVCDSNGNTLNINGTQPFKFINSGSSGSASNTTYGGEYDPIPQTSTVKASCTNDMYTIVTEILYAIKCSDDSGVQQASDLPGLLRSSGSPLLKNIKPVNDIQTPNIYYDNNGIVYSISFEGLYDNYMNYNVANMDILTFKSNKWIYDTIVVEKIIDGDIYSSLIYKYVDNKLYCSSQLINQLIQQHIVKFNQIIKSSFNSKQDHHYGYSIVVGGNTYNNIPVDLILNSIGSSSNDLSIIDFIDKNGEQFTVNDFITNCCLDFNGEQFNSIDISNFNYSALIDSNIRDIKYYQYINLSRVDQNTLEIFEQLFGEDYQNNLKEFKVKETVELTVSYVNGDVYIVDVYQDNKRVECVANIVETNNQKYICITTIIKNITNRELKRFVKSIDKQITEKYISRDLNGGYMQIYQEILQKYQLEDLIKHDVEIEAEKVSEIYQHLGMMYNEI